MSKHRRRRNKPEPVKVDPSDPFAQYFGTYFVRGTPVMTLTPPGPVVENADSKPQERITLPETHRRLLDLERNRILSFLRQCEQDGVARDHVTLVFVVDLRSPAGRHLAKLGLGNDIVERTLRDSASTGAPPTVSLFLYGGGGLAFLGIFLSEFLTEALCRNSGQTPVLVIDETDEPEFELIKFEAPS